MIYKKWEIILVPFPFTDLTRTKKRPALIISPNEYNKNPDVVITFITSKINRVYQLGDYKIQEWQKASLPKPSMLRMKFATIDKLIIVKKLGALNEYDIRTFSKLLVDFLA